MARPILLTVDIDAMRHNLKAVRARVGTSRIWAVAKANAYGHGIAAAVRGLAGADGLAVLDLSEAETARALGWHKPILMIEGAFSAEDLEEMARLEASTVIHRLDQVDMFLKATHRPKEVWLKLNTGMNRLGFGDEVSNQALLEACNLLAAATQRPLGWMTHFANADLSGGWQAQAERFHARHQTILSASRGFSSGMDLTRVRGPVSLANSAATLTVPEAHADWVRPGIALFGGTPFDDQLPQHSAAAFGLMPTQTLSSEIISVQQIKRGESVGYGSRFTASRDSRIGIVACGYADGYPRAAPDGTPVWILDRCVGIVGRVSMDMLTVDLTDHPQAVVGSPVELWGHHVPIDQVANAAGTIGYELMTKVTARVHRAVLDRQGS
jgi:alanine racemase